MKHRKYSTLRLEASTRTGRKVPVTLPYNAEYCKKYFCDEHLLFQLNNKEGCFLNHLCEKMDDENYVYIDRHFKEAFITYTKHIGIPEKTFNIGIIDKAVAKLKELHFIVQKQQEYCQVNPRYFFKGSEKDRLNVLEKEINTRFNQNLPLNGLLPIPEESLRNGDVDFVCLN